MCEEDRLEDQDDERQERGGADPVEDGGEPRTGGMGARTRHGRELHRREQEYERP